VGAWIGPAIIAAVISALVTAFGWYASHTSARRLDVTRRRERIQDVQTALRAEIRSYRDRLASLDIEGYADEMVQRIGAAAENGQTFTPFIPKEDHTIIFDAIVGEIHILPTEVIDPIVSYYKQVTMVSRFADDLRSDLFSRLEPSRKAEMYGDYIAMSVQASKLADHAINVLDSALLAKSENQ
jgi:hypothetical protein